MSTAESKITETAITNVVSKGFYSKNDIDSKGYQTSSQVQQTVNGLQVKVQESGGYNLIYNGNFKKDLNNLLFNSNNSDKVSVLLNDLDKDRNLVYKTNLKITNKFTLKFLSKADFSWSIVTKEYIEKILKNL